MRIHKLFVLMGMIFFALSCSEEELPSTSPFILLKQGKEFTQKDAYIPVGGKLKFGLSGVGDGVAITNLTVQRITNDGVVTELDKGMFIKSGGLDTTVSYIKGIANKETWIFTIMNASRDTASVSTVIYRGEGSAYGDIDYFPSITIAYQNNSEYPYFVDLHTGNAYDKKNVSGHEKEVDLVSYYYLSSGKSSPTLSCPGYPSAAEYYPEMNDWNVQNSTVYDYFTTDNDLISVSQFDAAQNDSLLVNGYLPSNVSGTCKYCYKGKIIPFKTANGKYGLIKVVRADEKNTGSIEIAVKIQK